MTLSDLQSRMTQSELNVWLAYVEENGPLNQSLRIESAVARAVAPFLKNVKARDLMPWPREQERELSAQEMAEQLTAKFKGLAAQTNSRKHR